MPAERIQRDTETEVKGNDEFIFNRGKGPEKSLTEKLLSNCINVAQSFPGFLAKFSKYAYLTRIKSCLFPHFPLTRPSTHSTPPPRSDIIKE